MSFIIKMQSGKRQPMLISPTEPLPIRKLGQVSSVPERFGTDVLFLSRSGQTIGIQRKEIKDLVASVHDGRLVKELAQMAKLDQGIVLIEGGIKWTSENKLMIEPSWTKTHHLGLMLSIQSKGYWTLNSSTLNDTLDLLPMFVKYFGKERSASLGTRPKSQGEWGTKSSREWQNHLLQSFEGIGSEKAKAILDKFGMAPLEWT